MTTNPLARLLRRLDSEAGSAMVEAALSAPILVMTVLWGSYFYEMENAKIKTAEAARYIAWQRAFGVNSDAEARNRFIDLESIDVAQNNNNNNNNNNGVAVPTYRNTIVINQMSTALQAAPLGQASLNDQANRSQQGGIAGFASAAMSAIGGTVDRVVGFLGFSTGQGAVKSTVEIKMFNKIVPTKIGFYKTAGGQSGTDRQVLDLTFKDQYSMYHDTWRAWSFGNAPSNTYATVRSKTATKVQGVAYLGLTNAAGGVLNGIGSFLNDLGLDFPLYNGYIDDSVVMRAVQANGRYGTPSAGAWRPTRTVDGDVLQGLWWKNDFCYCWGQNCRGYCWAGGGDNESRYQDVMYKRGVRFDSTKRDNFPHHSFNCRGDFFAGTRRGGDKLELEIVRGSQSVARQYYRFDNRSCTTNNL